MIINLTEKEIKTIDYCLQSKLIDVKGLAAIGACDRAVVEQMEGLIRKLETEAKDDCDYGIVVDFIKWDTDGDQKALKFLPKEVGLPYEFLHIHDQELTEDVIDNISEYLASEYGYCPKSFLIEVKATVTIHESDR